MIPLLAFLEKLHDTLHPQSPSGVPVGPLSRNYQTSPEMCSQAENHRQPDGNGLGIMGQMMVEYNIPEGEFSSLDFWKKNPQIPTRRSLYDKLTRLEIEDVIIRSEGRDRNGGNIFTRNNKGKSEIAPTTPKNPKIVPESKPNPDLPPKSLPIMADALMEELPDTPFTINQLIKRSDFENTNLNKSLIRSRLSLLCEEGKLKKIFKNQNSQEITYCKTDKLGSVPKLLEAPIESLPVCVKCGQTVKTGQRLCDDCKPKSEILPAIQHYTPDLETITIGIANDLKCILSAIPNISQPEPNLNEVMSEIKDLLNDFTGHIKSAVAHQISLQKRQLQLFEKLAEKSVGGEKL